MTIAGDLLREAAEIVDGSRNEEHGNKERSFATIAALWSIYLTDTDRSILITAEDVCVMMALLKIGRLCHGQPSKDHYMDAAGYMAIAREVNNEQREW